MRGGTLRWGRRSWQARSTCPIGSDYRDKLRQCLAGLERLLAEKRFDRPKNLMGLEIELNLAGADGMPRMMNARGTGADREPRFPDRTRHVQPGSEHSPTPIGRPGIRPARRGTPHVGSAYAHRKAGEVDAGIVMIGILPTLGRDDLVSSNLSDVDRYTLLNDQIVAARGEDFALDIEGVERLVCTSTSIAPGGRLHLRAAAPPGHAGPVRRRVERGAGGRRRADRRRRQLALPVRPGAVAGVAAPALPAGHRHPAAGAPGPGRAPADLVRRALDRLGVRALRGEPALLPAAAAHLRRRGPAAGPRRRAGCPRSPNSSCTTARSTAGTGPSTASPTASRTCGWRTACCPPDRPSPTCIANAAFYYGARPRPRRGVAAGVDPAAVRGGRGQLRRGLPARHRRAAAVAAARAAAGVWRRWTR